MGNTQQVYIGMSDANFWDDGYPSGGNYWSNYNGTDLNGDGIGDSPYIIDDDNTDHYPLMHPWSPLPVHNINTGFGYATIQEAIDANETLSRHVIFVDAGIYVENVVVNKSISLIGENRDITIIDGNGTGTVVHVTANNVKISGFTIRNSGPSSPDSGIRLDHSRGNNISHNIIANNVWGISLYYSNDNTISGNNASSNRWIGIVLEGSSSNNTLSGNILSSNPQSGIWLDKSNNNTLVDNIALNNNYGIVLGYNCSFNTLSDNIISNNEDGIMLEYYCSYNMLSGNTVSNNYRYGIILSLLSANNILVHNNFINNTNQVHLDNSFVNTWDNGVEGNYWSNYTGVDSDHDGIGDSWHEIDENNIDHYPLMGMFSDFNATSEHCVQTICNSSISDFQFNGTAISFNVYGENGTIGFCRICIPTALMNETYIVFVNGTEVTHDLLPCSNKTHSYLYFIYNHSTQKVIVVPEFPTWMSMLLILIILTVAIVFYKRRLLKIPIH